MCRIVQRIEAVSFFAAGKKYKQITRFGACFGRYRMRPMYLAKIFSLIAFSFPAPFGEFPVQCLMAKVSVTFFMDKFLSINLVPDAVYLNRMITLLHPNRKGI
jgi:hypothetical protein